jgi:hypothetical protein
VITSIRSFVTALTIAVASWLAQGCAHAPAGETTPDITRIETGAKAAAYFGTALYLLKHPESVQHFRHASAALDTLLSEGPVDPVKLHAVASQLPIKRLNSPEAVIIVQAAMLLLASTEYSIEIKDYEVAEAAAKGIRNGINLAMEAQQP